MAAIQRQLACQTLMQMQSLRIAAWGDGAACERFRAALMGEVEIDIDETNAALAAFGWRAPE